jgi:release factor glutamine methyltransferase
MPLAQSPRAHFRRGDWAKGISEQFDLVLINPPYVADDADLGPGVADFEPAEALFAGADGLDEYRRLSPQVARLIAPGGMAAIEIGHDQADAVGEILSAEGYRPRLVHDLAGRPRAMLI